MNRMLFSPFSRSTIYNFFSFFFALLLLTGCEKNSEIVSNLEEREANEIIVFLASKGISANKMPSAAGGPGGQGAVKWSIAVPEKMSLDAMAFLNQNGLPRIKGVNLLDLFAKQGLMSSEKEEMIRYQAGLAEQIASTIRKIDGVIDADVQISFPSTEGSTGMGLPSEAIPTKTTAAVYIKHQGVLDDPNSHLVLKIKRLVSGSINGLDLNDVTIISDKARFSDVTLGQMPENITAQTKEYVSIWSIVMNKASASRFRILFLFLSFSALIFAICTAWLIWKFYPSLKTKGGFKQLLKPTPFFSETPQEKDKN